MRATDVSQGHTVLLNLHLSAILYQSEQSSAISISAHFQHAYYNSFLLLLNRLPQPNGNGKTMKKTHKTTEI